MSSVQLPIAVLTFVGLLVALLGLFAAGNIAVVVVGLSAVAFAGVLGLFATRRA